MVFPAFFFWSDRYRQRDRYSGYRIGTDGQRVTHSNAGDIRRRITNAQRKLNFLAGEYDTNRANINQHSYLFVQERVVIPSP